MTKKISDIEMYDTIRDHVMQLQRKICNNTNKSKKFSEIENYDTIRDHVMQLQRKFYNKYFEEQIVKTMTRYLQGVSKNKTELNNCKSLVDIFGKEIITSNISADDCRNAAAFLDKCAGMYSISDDEIKSAFIVYSFIKTNKIADFEKCDCDSFTEIEILYGEHTPVIMEPKYEFQTEKERKNDEDFWWIDVDEFVVFIENLFDKN